MYSEINNICDKCNQNNLANAKYCSRCGNTLPTIAKPLFTETKHTQHVEINSAEQKSTKPITKIVIGTVLAVVLSVLITFLLNVGSSWFNEILRFGFLWVVFTIIAFLSTYKFSWKGFFISGIVNALIIFLVIGSKPVPKDAHPIGVSFYFIVTFLILAALVNTLLLPINLSGYLLQRHYNKQ